VAKVETDEGNEIEKRYDTEKGGDSSREGSKKRYRERGRRNREIGGE